MKRSYLPIIEKWVKNFINSMNSDVKDGFAQPGEDFGNIPKGIKIIFDGYGYNERTDNQDDTNRMSFAVFIHKKSLVDYFPPHEVSFNMVLHRPKEECCIYVWYNLKENLIEVLPFEETNSTELSYETVVDIIFGINNRKVYIPG